MSHSAPIGIDWKSAPFDHYAGIHRLAAVRSGHASAEHTRHQLYVARDRRTRAHMLIKITSKAGLVYEQNLVNEIASLSTINRHLPHSRYFPVLGEHGLLPDGRMYLTMSCFEEWPLATTVGTERNPARYVAALKTSIAVADALAELHALDIWHVDLNPMNILCRWQGGEPVIRIVDFESSFETARHTSGTFYNPPTTSGFSAPELLHQAPDARADVFSLGAVLYTLLAGFDWTLGGAAIESVEADAEIPSDLKSLLLTAVEPDPESRYRSIVESRAAVAAYLEHIWPGRS